VRSTGGRGMGAIRVKELWSTKKNENNNQPFLTELQIRH